MVTNDVILHVSAHAGTIFPVPFLDETALYSRILIICVSMPNNQDGFDPGPSRDVV
jgi:hypothetical protein